MTHTLRLVGGLLLVAVSTSGCGSGASEAEVQKPALVVNDLRLTPAELNQELAVTAVSPHEFAPSTGEEPEWLNRLIQRELLVQEAQRLGLDREPDFMRTIERFWKEALIKLLIERKAKEISATTHVYEPEIEASYKRMAQEVRARILSVTDESAARRLAQATDVETELASLGSALRDDSGWQWYPSGLLEPELDDLLLNTPPGHLSAPIQHWGRWIVVAVAERRARTIEPLATLRDEIQRTLQRQKETAAMEQWIAGLRANARIMIDREALATLKGR